MLKVTFQSTLPRGSDLWSRITSIAADNFNPRSLAGATVIYDDVATLGVGFQSTLPRGSDWPH